MLKSRNCGTFCFRIFWKRYPLNLSLPSFKTSRVRLRARTPPFHGGDTGSNPVRGTKSIPPCAGFFMHKMHMYSASFPCFGEIKNYVLVMCMKGFPFKHSKALSNKSESHRAKRTPVFNQFFSWLEFGQ
jgi:hypothetical protein